jgi:hypothetical protein
MNEPDPLGPESLAAGPSADELRRWIAAEVSLPSRLRYTALLLAGLASAGVTGALLVGEVGLPLRTRIALAVIMGVGLCWAGFAGWVLGRRRVLFATHHVVAARMAVAFSALFTIGVFVVGRTGGPGPTGYAVATGVAMLVVAGVHLLRARRRVQALTARRAELERRLVEGG